MDGVRRTSTSGFKPQALVLVPPRDRPAPLSQNTVTARIGLDGVRRNVPTPREMLASTDVASVQIPRAFPPTRTASKPVVAFSVIASALIVAGVTGSHFLSANAASDGAARASLTKVVSNPATQSRTAASPAAVAPSTSTPGSAPAVAQAENYASVQAILDAFILANGTQYTIYVKDLKSGTTASVNADRIMKSASLYKLFVAQSIYQKVDNGDLSFGQTGGLESGLTIDRCLSLMTTISDNACGHDLGSIIGWNKQDAALKSAGYGGTTLGDTNDNPQMTNAKDVGLLLERLYSGTSMSPNSTRNFIGLLKQQRVNDRFPTGLPAGTDIAHKTGDLLGYTHDAAIIYGSKTDFEVVVMSGPWNSPENSKPAFGTLAGQLNSYFNN